MVHFFRFGLHFGQKQKCCFVTFLGLAVLFQFRVVWSQPLEIRKTIKEELLPGFVIANLSTEPGFVSVVNTALNSGAISGNSTSGVSLHYSVLTSGNAHSQFFEIEPFSGVVSIKRNIDRERVCSFRDECHLSFQVAARSVYGVFFQLVNFSIVITDINDNPPEFTQPQFELIVPENTDVGRYFQLPTAFDRDTGASNRVHEYRILAGPSLLGLKTAQAGIDSTDIFLTLEHAITQENAVIHKVLIGAIDGGKPPLTGTLTVVVTISDINDHFPVFEHSMYTSRVPEIAGNGQVIAQVRATDADSGLHGQVFYSFSAQQPPDDVAYFRVDSKTGEIILTKSIEARAGTDIDLIVEASDGGHPPKTSRTLVKIHVEDTINSVPDIIVDTLGGSREGVAEVSEYAEIGKVVAYISVYDPDSGDNGKTSCRLSGSEFELVKLDDQGKYKAELMSSLDRERRDIYNITMTCTDSGFPPLMATAEFAVKVLDENDHEPAFSQRVYEATVYENNSIGAFIAQLDVIDKDIGINANVSFEINDVNKFFFNIDETGKVTAKVSLDREYSDKITATIVATDRGSPPLSSFATLTVNLLDINDVKPGFSQTIYTFEIEEDRPVSSLVGILEAYDLDLGRNKDIIYSIQDSRLQRRDVFLVGLEDGVIRINAALDREQKDVYSFIVLATDKGKPPLTGTASVIIRIIDTNDNNPYFLYPSLDNNTIAIPHSTEPRKKILSVQAHDIDADLNARIIYSISSVNITSPFFIDSNSGNLFTKDHFKQSEAGLYVLTIMANDQGHKQQRATQIPLYIHVYFDNSTMFSSVGSAGLSKEVITVLIVLPMLLLIIFIISVTLLCMKRRKAKKNLKGTVPNSASTSSTAKLQGGYYIAPGVQGSATFFTGKQDGVACNNNGVQDTVDGPRTPNPHVVVLSRTEPEAPAEIVEISINGYQNGLSGTLDRNRIDDDRFSTFRSQEDILAPSLRYGSLRRQDKDNSSINKKANDTFDDLSCDGSTSDSGRGGSDLEVNNGAAAAAAKQDKARAKAGTPISIKSGISHRLSPLPQHEKTLITFRGESPNSFKFDSDSETPTQSSQTLKPSSIQATSPNSNRDVPKFGSGPTSAFSDPSKPHRGSNALPSELHLPLRHVKDTGDYSIPSEDHISSGGQSSFFRLPHRLAPANMSMPHSTYPRHENETTYRDWGLNPSNSLTRRNPFPRQPQSTGNEFSHHGYETANGSASNNNVNSAANEKTNSNDGVKSEDLIPNYNEFEYCDTPIHHHRANNIDYNRQDSQVGRSDKVNLTNSDRNNAVTSNYHNMDSHTLDSHPVSVEEDFLLPPYPEVDVDEEDTLNIYPGYSDFSPDIEAEKLALFSKSKFESSA